MSDSTNPNKQRAAQTKEPETLPLTPSDAKAAARATKAPKPKVKEPKDYTKDDWMDDVVKRADDLIASIQKAIKPATIDYSRFQRPTDSTTGMVKPIHHPIQHQPQVSRPNPPKIDSIKQVLHEPTKKADGKKGKWKVQVDGKPEWYSVTDVRDTKIPAHLPGGGNMYTLAGHPDKMVHQSRITDLDEDDVEKCDMDMIDQADELIKALEALSKVNAEDSNRRLNVAQSVADRAAAGRPTRARMPWETIATQTTHPSPDKGGPKPQPYGGKISVRHQGEEARVVKPHPLGQMKPAEHASQATNVQHQRVMDEAHQEYRRRKSDVAARARVKAEDDKAQKSVTSGAIAAPNSVEPTVKVDEKLTKPPVSEAQRRLVHARAAAGESWAKEWAGKDPGGKLPERKESKKLHKCETPVCELGSDARTALVKSLFSSDEITNMVVAMADEGSIHRNSALEWMTWNTVSPELFSALDGE
jgi:hypothetical protein